jgi:hypothetical protein
MAHKTKNSIGFFKMFLLEENKQQLIWASALQISKVKLSVFLRGS